MTNTWGPNQHWGDSEWSPPNEAELARMRENILRRIEHEPQLPPEPWAPSPDRAPSGQGCALAFIVMSLVIIAFVFFAWWTL